MHTKTCIQCGTEFVPKRSDAKFCTSACRQKAFKKRKETFDDGSETPKSAQTPTRLCENEQRIQDHIDRLQFDEWAHNNIFPYLYPRHYYTPFGSLTAQGLKGIDPLDRKSLRNKPPQYSDYQWLEEGIEINGIPVNRYEGLFEEDKAPEQKEAKWTEREAAAVKKYKTKLRRAIQKLQEWNGEEVEIALMWDWVERITRYINSQAFQELPPNCPANEALEHLEVVVSDYLCQFEEEDETTDFELNEDWDELFEDMENEMKASETAQSA